MRFLVRMFVHEVRSIFMPWDHFSLYHKNTFLRDVLSSLSQRKSIEREFKIHIILEGPLVNLSIFDSFASFVPR